MYATSWNSLEQIFGGRAVQTTKMASVLGCDTRRRSKTSKYKLYNLPGHTIC
jgi:hypothetical protein